MSNIGMKESTDYNPPKLKVISQFGEKFILELIQRAIPSEVILGLGIAENNQNYEQNEQQY